MANGPARELFARSRRFLPAAILSAVPRRAAARGGSVERPPAAPGRTDRQTASQTDRPTDRNRHVQAPPPRSGRRLQLQQETHHRWVRGGAGGAARGGAGGGNRGGSLAIRAPSPAPAAPPGLELPGALCDRLARQGEATATSHRPSRPRSLAAPRSAGPGSVSAAPPGGPLEGADGGGSGREGLVRRRPEWGGRKAPAQPPGQVGWAPVAGVARCWARAPAPRFVCLNIYVHTSQSFSPFPLYLFISSLA